MHERRGSPCKKSCILIVRISSALRPMIGKRSASKNMRWHDGQGIVAVASRQQTIGKNTARKQQLHTSTVTCKEISQVQYKQPKKEVFCVQVRRIFQCNSATIRTTGDILRWASMFADEIEASQ